MQLVAKKLKRDPTEYQFRWRGNEKQFAFNKTVNDSIQSAASLLEKVKPAMPQDTAALKTIAEHQKHIHLVDRWDYGWQLVEAYQQDELADNEKDAKKIEDIEKVVELKNRHKCKASDSGKTGDPQQPTGFRRLPQFMGSFSLPPLLPFMPPPFSQPAASRSSSQGAWALFSLSPDGTHLKAHCPNKISKQYNDVLMRSASSVHASVDGCNDKVCSGSLCIDKPPD